ncbi:MAG: CDP-alcohol phosphatidyltransferase family protein [Dehalococcoidales bacterium]|nr:CDP-alcohol phosphatidyltransferase family protein [Dehalococcoidales bacterium]
MSTDTLKQRARRGVLPIAAVLVRLGLTPNMVTVIGFLLNVGVGLILAFGYQLAGGILVILVGLFDTLDGAVARVSNRVTIFGGFLDSTLDRYSEAVIFFGLTAFYVREGRMTEVLLVYAVIVGSLMVSYARARAEGLGLDCEVGLLQRPERVALLGLGLIINQVVPVLWLLAVMTNFTAAQRIFHVYRLTRQGESSQDRTKDRP